MLLLQFAIGIANDLADALADTLVKPHKPVPAGLLTRRQVCVALAVAGSGGLLAAASVGLPALAIGAVGLADGLLYDLRLKGTVVSWMPFSVGVALLPVYAWWGATGSWPLAMWGVIALAALAGVALALANALADLEKDSGSGVRSIATALGRGGTLVLNAGLLLVLQVVALATSLALDGGPWARALALTGVALGWIGVALAATSHARARQAGWEVQAIGVVILGAGWLWVLSAAGSL